MRGSVCGYVLRADGSPTVGVTVVGTTEGDDDARTPSDGEPVSGVLDSTTVSYSPFAPAVSTLTDGAGRFVFDRLREGQWLLRARGGRGETSGEARVRVFDDSMSAVTITVAEFSAGGRRAAVVRRGTRRGRAMTEGPRGSVRGRVVRARGGAPVVDAAVTAVRGPEPAPDIAPVTDALGRFALDGLAPGDWLLRAHGPDGETGEVTVRVTADSAASATIVVADGAAWGMSERDA